MAKKSKKDTLKDVSSDAQAEATESSEVNATVDPHEQFTATAELADMSFVGEAEDMATDLADEAELDFAAETEADSDVDTESELELSAENEIENNELENTELASFDSAEIEEVESLLENEIVSAIESLLFATEKPQTVAALKSAFQGTKVRTSDIRSALERLQTEYANPSRGVTLEEVAGGYQLRTKPDNQKYLLRTVKARPFRLSGPALEVLSIVAYKQPCTKAMVDEVRGVESGHLMRGLLDRGLLHFGEKSELPGRPMYYETSRKFLEIFGLRNIAELPTLNEIDQLIPEGIGESANEPEKKKLSDITGDLSTEVVAKTYSEGEEELLDISAEIKSIQTSSEFFENEKLRLKKKRDEDHAQDIRERLLIGETVEEKDQRWLARYEAEQNLQIAPAQDAEGVREQAPDQEPVSSSEVASESKTTDLI